MSSFDLPPQFDPPFWGYGGPRGSKMVPIEISSQHSYSTSYTLYTYLAPFGNNTQRCRRQTDRAIGKGRLCYSSSSPKTTENDVANGFILESPNLAHTSILTYLTAIPDMTSLATFDWQLSKFKKLVENAASYGFGSNFSRTFKARITIFNKPIGDNRPHKPVRYDVTSCFWSAAKCN